MIHSCSRMPYRRTARRTLPHRKLAAQADSVIVVTGAIFANHPERIGAGGVAVPTALYKVILACELGQCRLTAAIMPNTESTGRTLDSFTVPAAEVEKRTGLKFFPELDAIR